MEIYAIDYTLFQTDRAPIKVDFIALQKVTETYLKDHMVDEYKMSTQVKMVDFTTSFVTAMFTYVCFSTPFCPLSLLINACRRGHSKMIYFILIFSFFLLS